MRKVFILQTNDVKRDLEEYCKANVKNFDDLYDKGLRYLISKVSDFLKFTVAIANENGATDVDAQWYAQFTSKATYLCSVFKYYNETANQFMDLAEAMSSYRAAKSANRSRWQGGGFGIGGAIKGAFTAGP